MAVTNKTLNRFMQGWMGEEGQETMGAGGYFERNTPNMLQSFFGSRSQQNVNANLEKTFESFFSRAMKGVPDGRGGTQKLSDMGADDQVRLLKRGFERITEQLGDVVDPKALEEIKRKNQRIVDAYGEFAKQAELAKRNGDIVQQQKQQQAAELVGSTSFRGLNQENQKAIIALNKNAALNARQDPESLAKMNERLVASMSQKQLMQATSGSRFLLTGQYKRLNPELANTEAGSEMANLTARKIRQGINTGVQGMSTAENYEQQSFLTKMISGGAGVPSAAQSRAVLQAGVAAAKQEIAKADKEIQERNKRIEQIKRSMPEGAARDQALEKEEAGLANAETRKKELSSSAMEASKKLAENIERPFKEAGASFKNAMANVIGMMGMLGEQLATQLRRVGAATLNPVVNDLIDSIKYGLDIGLKAGQMIYNVSKGAMDGAAKTFGFGGGVWNFLGSFLGAGGGGGGVGGAGGGLAKLAARGLVGGGIALAGFGAGELIRGGISKDAREKRVEMNEAEKRTSVYAGTVQGAGVGAGLGFAVGGPIGAAIGAGIGGVIGWLDSKSKADTNAEDVRRTKLQEEQKKKEEAKSAGALPGIGSFKDLDKMLSNIGDTKLGTVPGIGEVNVAGGAKALAGVTAYGIAGGTLPGAEAARALSAGAFGLLGGAAVGASMAVMDFFTKSLQRGAEELGKFSNISNQLNIGMTMQLRRFGNAQGRMGDRNNLTEADLAQALLTKTGLIDIGFNREQVGAAFIAMNKMSYEGTESASKTITLAGRAARQLGVDINEMLKSYAETDILGGGVGKGSELYNRILFGVAPRNQDNEVTFLSKTYADALVSSAKQLQASGSKNLESGTKITQLLAGLGDSLKGTKFGEYVQFNPSALGQSLTTFNNLLQGSLTGDPLSVAIAAQSGISPRTALEGIQTPAEFASVVNSLGELASQGGGLDSGRLTEDFKRNILPGILKNRLPGMSVDEFDSILTAVMSGDIQTAFTQFKESDAGKEPMSLQDIAEQIGGGFNALQKAAEEGMQQNLQLMENNLGSLIKLSDASNKVAGDLLSMGQTVLGPAIEALQWPLNTLHDLMNKTKEEENKEKGQKAEEERLRLAGNAGYTPMSAGIPSTLGTPGGISPDQALAAQQRLGSQGFKYGAFNSAEEQEAFNRSQYALVDTFAELANTSKGSKAYGLFDSFLNVDKGIFEGRGLLDFNLTPAQYNSPWTFNTPAQFRTSSSVKSSIYQKALFDNFFNNSEKFNRIKNTWGTSEQFNSVFDTSVGAGLDMNKAGTATIDKNNTLTLRSWLEGQEDPSVQVDPDKLARALQGAGYTGKIEDIVAQEALYDFLLKADTSGINVKIASAEGLKQFAIGGGAANDPIANAVMSGKNYVFLAGDLSVHELKEFNAKVASAVN